MLLPTHCSQNDESLSYDILYFWASVKILISNAGVCFHYDPGIGHDLPNYVRVSLRGLFGFHSSNFFCHLVTVQSTNCSTILVSSLGVVLCHLGLFEIHVGNVNCVVIHSGKSDCHGVFGRVKSRIFHRDVFRSVSVYHRSMSQL